MLLLMHKVSNLKRGRHGSVGRIFKFRTTTNEEPSEFRHGTHTRRPPAVDHRHFTTCTVHGQISILCHLRM